MKEYKNRKRLFYILDRASKIKLKKHTKKSEKDIKTLIKQHLSLLNKSDNSRKSIVLNKINFYSISEWALIKGPLKKSINNSDWSSYYKSLWHPVYDSVYKTHWKGFWDNTWELIWHSIWISLRTSVEESVWDSVSESDWNPLWDTILYTVWDLIRQTIWTSFLIPNTKNLYLPIFEINELGAVFYGIDDNGIAYIIMPNKNEIKRD